MKSSSLTLLVSAAALVSAPLGLFAADGDPAFANIFTPNAVLQRDCPLPIWGTAKPGTPITVALDNTKLTATTDESGRWLVTFPAQTQPGSGHTLSLSSADSTTSLENIAIGDVWICSGQSNMEMNFSWGIQNGDAELADASFDDLRLFIVQNAIDTAPRADVSGSWSTATPDSVRPFSACGFFFGRKLHRELNVPVGLIDSTWSGTIAETWLSLENAATIPGLEQAVANRIASIEKWDNGGKETYEADLAAWNASFDGSDPFANATTQPYQDSFQEEGWKAVSLPTTIERAFNCPSFDGIVWFRRSLELTAEQAAATNATLSLGAIDDADVAWINGTKVGETAIFNQARIYTIPAGTLKAGTNLIAIRTDDTGGIGGFTGKAEELFLSLEDQKISLAGPNWTARANKVPATSKPTTPNSTPNVPAACYNAMIRPLYPLAIRGAIWYQGCSNVGRHAQYETLLPAVVTDWRKGFTSRDGEFPFYIVQLAAFLQTHEEPQESAWAAMRWSMMKIGETFKNSGTIVTIDVGNHSDIHPKDKRTVGERLCRMALARTYGTPDLLEAGPVPTALSKVDNTLVVSFKNAPTLTTSDKAPVKGFQIASAEGPFSWTTATLKDNTAILTIPEGLDASRVRYAWDDYPDCNLVGAENLPCGPFELTLAP